MPAEINITFKAEDKSVAVTIDGKPVKNVVGVDLYPSYDDAEKFRCNIIQASRDEDAGITTVTHLMAAESQGAKAGEPSKEFPGFVVVKSTADSKVRQDIDKFFQK